MKMDILAILMVAFCLFAIGMFILFYIYAKKYHNEKNMSEDYNVYDGEEDEYNSINNDIELVDIKINDKDYVFEANGYPLYDFQEVDVVINGNVYTGTVTRGNYKDSLSNYTQVPTKLVLQEKEEKKEESKEEVSVDIPESLIIEEEEGEEEFIPKKKS